MFMLMTGFFRRYRRYLLALICGCACAFAITTITDSTKGQGADTTPPIIGSIAVSNIFDLGVTITWKTNEPADSQVEYGATTNYGNLVWRKSLYSNHWINLWGLKPGALYHFRVKSKDAAGNLSVSADFTFTTKGGSPPPSPPPPNQPPTVSITASPSSGVAPLTVGFSAKGSDPDGSIVSYQWSFGDGDSASGSNVSHTYRSPGAFISKVTVTDNAGAVASASIAINVSAAAPPTLPTISSFSASPNSITSGQSSTLSWSVTGATGLRLDPGAINVTGATSRSVTPATTTVYTLTATNNAGSVTRNVTVTVSSVPPPPPPPPPSSGVTYYVSPNGSDSNPGTEAQPFKTIQKAANIVNPGDTVLVENGVYTYNGPNDCFGKTIVCVVRGGAPGKLVTFKSRNKWGAKIDGQNGVAATGFGFEFKAGYIRIQDFEISGLANVSGSAGGIDILNGGGNSEIIGNHIHDIGHVCTSTSNGENGIFIKESNVLVEGNVIHDNGRLAPGVNGCSVSNENWKNHDHGIYHDAGDNVTIRNNIIYNIKQGWPIQVWPNSRRGMNIVNNTIAFSNEYSGKLGAIIFWGPSGGMTVSDSDISNNIFYQVNTVAIWMGHGGGGINFSNVRISNNIVSNGSLLKAESGVNVGALSISNNRENVDPGMVNPAGFDFHLRVSSLAIDSGAFVTVPTDFEGRSRPQGGGYDIGAYEYR